MKPFFCLILILNLLKTGAHVPDSVLDVSRRLKTDTDRVNFFYKEGFDNRAIDPQYSFDCAKIAEQLAQKTSLPFYIAKAGNLLGILYYRKHDLNKALSYHKNAMNLRMIINDKKGIAGSETNLGNLYSELKHYTLAQQSYLKALQLNEELNDQKQVGNCLLNLGVLNADIKNVPAARDYFVKAIRNAAVRFDYELQAMCFNNLADINITSGRLDEAIADCNNSLKVKALMDNEMEMADSYLSLAAAYFLKKDEKSGFTNLAAADSIIQKYDYTSARVLSLKIKADYYSEVKNYEAGLTYLTKYHFLKDSLDKVEKEIDLDNNFFEENILKAKETEEPFSFPYVYLNILIASLILVIIFIFKPQQ